MIQIWSRLLEKKNYGSVSYIHRWSPLETNGLIGIKYFLNIATLVAKSKRGYSAFIII